MGTPQETQVVLSIPLFQVRQILSALEAEDHQHRMMLQDQGLSKDVASALDGRIHSNQILKAEITHVIQQVEETYNAYSDSESFPG